MIGRNFHRNASRRSSVQIRNNLESAEASTAFKKGVSAGRRRACAVADHKTCALIQTKVKLGELV